MDSDKSTKNYAKYSCTICTYNTRKKTDYMKHLATSKHIKNMNDSKTSTNDGETDNNLSTNIDKQFHCICGKQYKYDTGYYRHKKNCTYIPPNETPETKEKPELEHNETNEPDNKWIEIIQMLIKENQEIRNLVITQHNTMADQSKTLADQNKTIIDQNKTLVDQNKTLTELVKNQQPTTNNSHNNNTNYNINMFLSEKCKDAKNMTEFIETLKTKLDMFQIEETGYVDGISKLFIDELKSMEVTERPLHCTDERRITFYVHNNNAWNKDQNLNDTKRAINRVSHTNLQQCLAWSANVPDKEADREEHITRSIRLCKEANSSSEDVKVDKIIKNISKEIPLNKQVISEL